MFRTNNILSHCSFFLKCIDCKRIYVLNTSNKNIYKYSTISAQQQLPDASKLVDKSIQDNSISNENIGSTLKPIFGDNGEKSISSIVSASPFNRIITKALKENAGGIYLINRDVAKTLSDYIAPELLKTKSFIVEANPGLGFLSECLLEAGVPQMVLMESNPHFFKYLNKKNKSEPKLEVMHKDVLRCWQFQNIGSKDKGKEMFRIFSKCTSLSWEEDPAVKIIGTISNNMFIRTIIQNIITRTGFVKYGRPELILIVDPLTYHTLMDIGETKYRIYKHYIVLFQLLFEYEVLCKIKRDYFVPSPIQKKKRYSPTEREALKNFGDTLYLIKITPDRNLYSSSIGENLLEFNYFLKQVLSPSSRRLIPFLEQWVPGCGPELIVLGYSIYTQVGELSPEEFRDVFLKFISWNESREKYSFYASMDNYHLKTFNLEDT